jgi:hypothetical protein
VECRGQAHDCSPAAERFKQRRLVSRVAPANVSSVLLDPSRADPHLRWRERVERETPGPTPFSANGKLIFGSALAMRGCTFHTPSDEDRNKKTP